MLLCQKITAIQQRRYVHTGDSRTSQFQIIFLSVYVFVSVLLVFVLQRQKDSNPLCITVIQRHRGELNETAMLHGSMWSVATSSVFAMCWCLSSALGRSLCLWRVRANCESRKRMWWQVISEQVCLHHVQHLSTEIHWHVSSANCCQSVHMLWCDDVKHSAGLKKQNNNNKKKKSKHKQQVKRSRKQSF